MTRLIFDHNRFGDFMSGRTDIKVHDKKNHGWNERDNKAMHYKGSDFEFRTWWHSFSQCRKDAAILVSCKIDQRRNIITKDDHMIIMASLSREGGVIAVQAAMQSIDHKVSGHTEIIVDNHLDTGIRLRDAIHKSIDAQLGKKKDASYRYFGEIAHTNLQCIAASCILK